jgi:tRNA G18 (ribose-2'-O)-methylase SpoU
VYNLRHITTLDLPELQPYRTMRRQLEQRQQGIFVAEGEKVVRRLIESSLPVISTLLPEKWFLELEPVLARRPDEVQVFVAEKPLLETLTGFSMYQGLLAVGKVPRQPTLEELLGRAERPLLLAAVDALSSADNLGSLIRNCAGFRVSGLLVGETCTSPFLRRAVRSSMGAVFELPIIESRALAEDLKWLREKGIGCVAAHPRPGCRSLPQVDFARDCCLVFGSEGYGISAKVLENCNETMGIPMPPSVDSLNVAGAAAVCLYEVNRQRGQYGAL